MSKFQESYRKFVWNDFSTVEKARFLIFESNHVTIGSCIPNAKNELKFVEELPVQINPSRFECNYHIDPMQITNGLTKTKETLAEGFNPISFGGERDSDVRIPQLTFDIYDEYNARTVNGGITTELSLMNKKFTSLPNLIGYARDGQHYAQFKWGEIKKFGLLTGVDVEYVAFSPWGQPLKATASVRITEQSDEYLGKLDITELKDLKNTGKKVLTGIKNLFR